MPRPCPHEMSVTAQQQWINEHGGSLSGYLARYGSKDDPQHFGHGGEAIYAADVAELQRRQQLAVGRPARSPRPRH